MVLGVRTFSRVKQSVKAGVSRLLVLNSVQTSTVFLMVMYSVILSVLDPRKCEYLKDYSLDFEHAYTLLHEKHVDTCLPLSDILTSSGQRLASGAMSRTAVSLCFALSENLQRIYGST